MACVDEADLHLMIDGELDDVRLELLHHHLGCCEPCRERLRLLRGEVQGLQHLLDEEDAGEAEAAADAVGRVRALVDGAPRRRSLRKSLRVAGLRVALMAAAAALILVAWNAVSPGVAAAPGRILDAATIRDNAWAFQPDKVLHWVIESDISNSSRLPDGHYRTVHYQSNIKGAEGSVFRKFQSNGELLLAVWRRPDGSVVSYDARRIDRLRVEPPAAVLRAALPELPLEEREALASYLSARATDSMDLSVRRTQFSDWLIDAATRKGTVRMSLVRSPTAGPSYYIRSEYTDPSRLDTGVTRLVSETYIESQGFRRYRLRTQRHLTDGRLWIEDARWTLFAESSPEEFQANTLEALLQESSAVTLTAREIAQARLAQRARRENGQ